MTGQGADAGSGVRPLGYRPQLDGVRAVAIVLVLLFHTDKGAGLPLLHGGFLGVDVFFVLSGFLITSLLIDERRSTGRIRLGAFWGRRVARLFPLLWALLGLMAFVKWVHPITGLTAPTKKGFVGLLAYVGNWFPATNRGDLMQLKYLWSLSVEEQFYVVWPLVVVGVLAFVGRRAAGVRPQLWVAGVAIAGAVGVMVVRAATTDGNDYFFNTVLRADGLLLGAALAASRPLWHDRIRRTLAGLLIGAGAALTAWIVSIAWVGSAQMPTWRLPTLELGVVLLTIGLVAQPTIAISRALGTRPLVWLGRRAYALYLVHLPIYDLLMVHLGPNRPRLRMAYEWPIALVVAHLAHITIELPAQRVLRRKLRAEHVRADPAPHDIESAATP